MVDIKGQVGWPRAGQYLGHIDWVDNWNPGKGPPFQLLVFEQTSRPPNLSIPSISIKHQPPPQHYREVGSLVLRSHMASSANSHSQCLVRLSEGGRGANCHGWKGWERGSGKVLVDGGKGSSQKPSSMEEKQSWAGQKPQRTVSLADSKMTDLRKGATISINKSEGWASLVAQRVKNLPSVQDTWVQSLGWEDLL